MGVPNLVNPNNFDAVVPLLNTKELKIKNSKRLNIIVLVGFVLFTIFFLYNCKYGIFKSMSSDPMPFSMVYNLS